MKIRLILLFIISLGFSAGTYAQEEEVVEEIQQDSIPKKKYAALRFGVDISMPISELFEEEQKGMDIVADFRINQKFYIAGEFGTEEL